MNDTVLYANCVYCGRRFERTHRNQKLCNTNCRAKARAKKARGGMRGLRRLRLRGGIKDKSCQVCGYSDTFDLHHEGENKYILCPNHHALIDDQDQVVNYPVELLHDWDTRSRCRDECWRVTRESRVYLAKSDH